MTLITEWLMMDRSHCKAHPNASGARGGNQDISPKTKVGLTQKYTWPEDAHGIPARVIISEGTRADCKQSSNLIDVIVADALLADRYMIQTSQSGNQAGYGSCYPAQKESKRTA